MSTGTSSYAKSYLHNNIIVNPLGSLPNIEGLGLTLYNCMQECGNKEEETYKRLLQKCVRTAIHMQSLGVKPGDVVVICSFNHLDTFVPLIAAWFVGAQAACIVPQLSLSDTVYLLKQVRPKLLFVSTNAVDLIEKTLEEGNLDGSIVVFGKSQAHMNFQDFIAPADGTDKFVPYKVTSVKETALITFSSGTTATPKGVCLNHYGLLAPILLENNPHNRIMLTSSAPYWISAIVVLIRSIVCSCTRVIVAEFNDVDVWNWIKTYKINYAFFGTSLWISLMKNGRPDDADTSSLERGDVCGSSISKDQMIAIKRIFPNTIIMNRYGQSEGSTVWFSLYPLADPINLKVYNERPHSIGRSTPGTECKVVDIETGKALGPHQNGELLIKSNFSMNGYYKLDSSGAWDSEGFVKTGDFVYYDEDLSFYFMARIKEMLKYRSWQISPVLLEEVLASHPSVKKAIVVGIPHAEDGDHPTGVVELCSPATEAEIQQFVDAQVSEMHRLRGGIKFIDAIPVSHTGKSLRLYVKNLLLRGEI